MKKLFITVLMICMTLTAVNVFASGSKEAAQGSKSAPAKNYTLKIGIVVAQSDPMYKGLIQLQKSVAAKTNGHLKIQVYASSALGDTKDLQSQLKIGANVGTVSDAARLATMVPQLGILGAPYVVKDFAQAQKLTQSSWWHGLENQLAQQDGIRILSFDWYQGARSFLTNKPIHTPADLHNLKIRTPGAPVWQDSIRAMGAVPVAMAWSSVYPGIQQGVIDGAEAQPSAVWGAHLYEVIHYIDLTQHFQLISPLIVGEKWFKQLPASYQKILTEEAVKAGAYASNLTIKDSQDYLSKMESKGVKVIHVDKAPFVQAAQSVYTEIKGYAALKQKVDQIVGQ